MENVQNVHSDIILERITIVRQCHQHAANLTQVNKFVLTAIQVSQLMLLEIVLKLLIKLEILAVLSLTTVSVQDALWDSILMPKNNVNLFQLLAATLIQLNSNV